MAGTPKLSSVRGMQLRSSFGSRSRALLGAILLAVGLSAGSALPAAATPSTHHRVLTYVALGDSYAAGQATDCTHTRSSYPRRLDRLREVKLVGDAACAAATTATVLQTQLGTLHRGVRLVTVTVGANDLDVAGLEQACTAVPSSCDVEIAKREALLPALFVNLTRTYTAIAAAAPRARILVTGYPALFASGPIHTAEATLDATIHGAVAAAAATGVHVRYVDVQFTGHTVDSPDPWFVLSGPNIFHPNAHGDRAFARAIAARL